MVPHGPGTVWTDVVITGFHCTVNKAISEQKLPGAVNDSGTISGFYWMLIFIFSYSNGKDNRFYPVFRLSVGTKFSYTSSQVGLLVPFRKHELLPSSKSYNSGRIVFFKIKAQSLTEQQTVTWCSYLPQNTSISTINLGTRRTQFVVTPHTYSTPRVQRKYPYHHLTSSLLGKRRERWEKSDTILSSPVDSANSKRIDFVNNFL